MVVMGAAIDVMGAPYDIGMPPPIMLPPKPPNPIGIEVDILCGFD
jgi:hypothetical protein